MGKYLSCPNCTNVQKGTLIYKCGKCNTIFCYNCAKGALNRQCPSCGHAPMLGHKMLGSISDKR